ncbi:MAG: cytochrome c oxidase subunit 3 [Thioalkalispiraceae bacterium]|jgi:cytochrome c oxidase subunit 3
MSESNYYLPEPSHWPLVGSLGLFTTTFGFAYALNADGTVGNLAIMYVGMAIIAVMMFGWFGTVIRESEAGKYNAQVDTSFRMGMMWFIFSEVMFFAAFFGALFYIRQLSVPWLGDDAGLTNNASTHQLLWDKFQAAWPLLENPDPEKYPAPSGVVDAWGIPLLNTILLITSSFTVTFAHHALKKDQRGKLVGWMFITLVLGFTFLGFQVYEYIHAISDYGLKLSSGTYGSTFYMLTGFHGAHVTIGAIMLTVMLLRILKGHFTAKNHFAFEAAAWYWHFVDVVWVGLFIFVYAL